MENYDIRFTFRGEAARAYVSDYGSHAIVSCNREDILNDFTGAFKFVGKKFQPGHQNNREAKDLQTLVIAMAAQLK